MANEGSLAYGEKSDAFFILAARKTAILDSLKCF
jgi:hypothetical protein